MKKYIRSLVLEQYGEKLLVEEVNRIVDQIMFEWNEVGDPTADVQQFVDSIVEDFIENYYLGLDAISD